MLFFYIQIILVQNFPDQFEHAYTNTPSYNYNVDDRDDDDSFNDFEYFVVVSKFSYLQQAKLLQIQAKQFCPTCVLMKLEFQLTSRDVGQKFVEILFVYFFKVKLMEQCFFYLNR